MMKTRSQRKLEDDEETVAKHSKTDEDDLAKALKESLDDVLAKQPPSTSNTDESSDDTKTNPVSFTTIFQTMKCQGISLPKFYKTLRKVAELVESDDVGGSKMMMLYLHNHNPDSKHFMENVFTDQKIVDIIRNHFVIWAGDVSREDDRAMVEEEVEGELSKEVVDLIRQYQVEDYPLLMVVMLLDGQHQVMRVFSGVQDIPTLYQGLRETIFTLRSVMEDVKEEGVDDEDVVEEDATPSPTPVIIQLQVGPCIHTAQFNPLQKLEDLFQYVAFRIGLEIGQFSL